MDYHSELDGHCYSFSAPGGASVVELRVSATTVEIHCGNQRVVVHLYNARRYAHMTTAEHMPLAGA